MRLTTEWYRAKTKQVQSKLHEENLDAILLLDANNIFYTSGFFHQSTERPLGLLIPENGEPSLFVPKLEQEMAEETWISSIHVYFDYPGLVHPIAWMLKENKRYKRIGIDQLSIRQWEIASQSHPNISMTDLVYTMRLVKDSEEIRLLEAAAIYADFLVEKTREAIIFGYSEMDAYNYARDNTVQKMVDEIGDLVFINHGATNGAVLYGAHSAHPHGLMSALIKPKLGDVIEAGFGALVSMYESESEHTFIYGEPSKEIESYFNAMYNAWKAGLETARPGIRCCDVNKASLDQIRDAGYEKYLRHRMGHGKGIQEHEPPWIEEGDMTILEPGMIISDEPGLYVPGVGGFRHSDTLLITEDGCRRLTKYPREIEHCIIIP
jgi:Xaa-Pro dipeptidase